MRVSSNVFLSIALGLVLAACGGHNGGNGNGDGGMNAGGDGGGGGGGGDGGNGTTIDGGGGNNGNCQQVMCMEGKEAGNILQCGNCVDDDGDMLIDGFDPECSGPCDDDEATFSTGIPGDNKDPKWQDCFFDGDSGSGNDECCYHSCCYTGATTGTCDIDKNFDPATDCPKGTGTTANGSCDSTVCATYCGALTPPGCDCFGCCTVCDGTNCKDVYIGGGSGGACTVADLNDPTKCPVCTKSDVCGGGDCNADPGGDPCVLCPGQDPGDLPDSCGGSNTCPSGETTCTSNADCTSTEYCSNGCCLTSVIN